MGELETLLIGDSVNFDVYVFVRIIVVMLALELVLGVMKALSKGF